MKSFRPLFYLLFALLMVAVGVLIDTMANVPAQFQPYLWLYWPVLGALAILFVVLHVFQTRKTPPQVSQSVEPMVVEVQVDGSARYSPLTMHIQNIDERIVSSKRSIQKEDRDESIEVNFFYGRKDELARLTQWINTDGCRIISLLGIGGIGKTTLSAKLVETIRDQFEYVIWRSLRNAPSVGDILGDCLQFLSNQQKPERRKSVERRTALLIEHLQRHRCLIVLDNAESILQEGDQTGEYREGYEGYDIFLQRLGEASHQSCLLLTSREKLKELDRLESKTSLVRSLRVVGLGPTEGQEILKDSNLSGTEEAWATLVSRYGGNPLALKLIATTIQNSFGGDIAGFLAQEKTSFEDIYDLLNQRFDRLSSLEEDILYWLAINREPVSLEVLREDMVRPLPDTELWKTLESLQKRSLIEKNEEGLFTLQSVLMDYMTNQLIDQVCKEITTGVFTRFNSHALFKAESKDSIRYSQIQLIFKPIINRLAATLGRDGVESKLQNILLSLRKKSPRMSGYAGGNAINLLVRMECDLSGYDFSDLTIWQAYLPGVVLHDVNFAHSDLSKSVFTKTFGSIVSVAFSPGGKLLVAGGADGEIRAWQVTDSKQLFTYKGHAGAVMSIAFSSDGRILATGSDDQTVKLWDVQTGQCLKTLQGHTNWVRSVAFSPNGLTLASSGDDQTVKLWDVRTGQCLKTLQGHTNWIWSIAFSPDENILASGADDQTIRLWAVRTGQCLKILRGHTDWVRSIAFSSGGNMLATGSADQTIKLWDVNTGECLKTLHGHIHRIRAIAFSPNGSTLASGGEGPNIRLWDIHTGQCTQALQGHTDWVNSIAFSPDGEILASGSDDHSIRLCDVQTGRCIRTLQGPTNGVWSVTFSPDGRVVASGSEDQIVKLWNAQTGQNLKMLRGHTQRVRSVAFSPDGGILASSSDDQTVKLWDVLAGQCLKTLQGHTSRVRSVVFSGDGQTLTSRSADQIVKVWDVSTGECLETFEGRRSQIRSVAFSPDGNTFASGDENKTLNLWDVRTGQCLKIFQGHMSRIWSVAFGPVGDILASGSEDQTVRLWNVHTGQCLRVLQGHTHGIWSLAFSPDGEVLVSGSEDETIRFWNVRTGQCEKTVKSDRPYERMNITGVTGLIEAQKNTLKVLGAVERLEAVS